LGDTRRRPAQHGVLTDLASSHSPATLSRFAAKDPAAYARLKAGAPGAPWPI
jgi:hypothetical protein